MFLFFFNVVSLPSRPFFIKFLCPDGFTKLTISGLQVEIQVSAQISWPTMASCSHECRARAQGTIIDASHNFKKEQAGHLMRGATAKTHEVKLAQ